MTDIINNLIAKRLSGNISSEEEIVLNSWIQQSDDNKAEFEKVKRIWEVSYNLKREEAHDVELAWSDFQNRVSKPQIKQRMTKIHYLRIAAGLALIACLTVLLNLIFSASEVPSNIVALQTAPIHAPEPSQAPVTQLEVADSTTKLLNNIPDSKDRKKIIRVRPSKNIAMVTLAAGDSAKAFLLPDNTLVFLNENSTLSYPENFSKNNRKISLTGEAYFEVKKDTMQFVVACRNTITRGTSGSFNIKGYTADKEVEVIIVSGNAEFSGVGKKQYKKLVLNQGDRGVYTESGEIQKAKVQKSKDYKWWQKKNLRSKIRRLIEKIKDKFK